MVVSKLIQNYLFLVSCLLCILPLSEGFHVRSIVCGEPTWQQQPPWTSPYSTGNDPEGSGNGDQRTRTNDGMIVGMSSKELLQAYFQMFSVSDGSTVSLEVDLSQGNQPELVGYVKVLVKMLGLQECTIRQDDSGIPPCSLWQEITGDGLVERYTAPMDWPTVSTVEGNTSFKVTGSGASVTVQEDGMNLGEKLEGPTIFFVVCQDTFLKTTMLALTGSFTHAQNEIGRAHV